jgi:hypothetical protein
MSHTLPNSSRSLYALILVSRSFITPIDQVMQVIVSRVAVPVVNILVVGILMMGIPSIAAFAVACRQGPYIVKRHSSENLSVAPALVDKVLALSIYLQSMQR